jgi:hypothetical protein
MAFFKVDEESIWALYDELDNQILYVFTSREDAIVKMADYEDVSALQLSNVIRTEEGWVIRGLSWKELVFDLVKNATSQKYEDLDASIEVTP